MRDGEAQDVIHKKELEEFTTILEQLALVSKESESGPTMNAHDFINKLEFGLNNPYIPTKEEIIVCLMEEVMHLTMNPLKKLTMCKLVMWWWIASPPPPPKKNFLLKT